MKSAISYIVASFFNDLGLPNERRERICNFDNDYYGDQKCICD